ncbi:hypothetical protein K503DRAFT_857513 [Rhizopogon vinicolor AM-OR11-026]|uniref:Phosphatase PP2A regulatory subunit A/Splicing factor 3B subunit 1-like HEAT repeat domain-containing protein n=1 Tax=Rhizopogon vinicolor AM-OR11-026 TaxID=1314800 RepID=A0A1B7MX45_9AGAM|nr:hypothetical protein K503DRAFT_857513 [Rhizopogon vinicolor AM-OR11-026]
MLGASDNDERLEVRVVGGIIYSSQGQTTEDQVMRDGFELSTRSSMLLAFVSSHTSRRSSLAFSGSSTIRAQRSDSRPQISQLGWLSCSSSVGKFNLSARWARLCRSSSVKNIPTLSMNPPVKDLLPRTTLILHNRHKSMQEASTNLIDRIADRGAELAPTRERMRIGFELPDLLEAHKKGIRRTPVNPFSYIAKSSGPQVVLLTLLTDSRVQERQSRVCSTIAIAIVAETCGPFTCIPAILNEYRTAKLNVRTDCLKSLTFVFEYIDPQSAYYCDLVVTLLEDALTDRDLVRRQIASVIVKHTALGVAGMGSTENLIHLPRNAKAPSIHSSVHMFTL